MVVLEWSCVVQIKLICFWIDIVSEAAVDNISSYIIRRMLFIAIIQINSVMIRDISAEQPTQDHTSVTNVASFSLGPGSSTISED